MAKIERTRALVENSETFDGDIFPTVQAELERPVKLREEATVKGSIYGHSVETGADSTVEGSAMGVNGVELDGSYVHGEVGTPGKVVGANSRIDGTVTGQRVRLTNSIVRGNVVGDSVILEDCVVLGIATAERKLELEGSLCYTFQSRGTTKLSETTIVLPQARVTHSVDLETPVAVAGLGLISTDTDEDGELPEMTAEDMYSDSDNVYLTLANRILNIEKITERLDELERAVLSAVDDSSSENGTEMTVDEVLELLEVSLSTDNILSDVV